MSHETSSGRLILDVVAAADRHRRRRDAVRALARIAPIAAVVIAAIAAGLRLTGGSRVVAPVLFGLATVSLAALGYLRARTRPTSDAIALQVDTDASLGGELRSAHWFASTPDDDPWTAFHLERAVDRARGLEWRDLYPSVRAARSWTLTAACAIAVAALSVSGPARATLVATTAGSGSQIDGTALAIPAELAKQIEAALAKLDGEQLSPEELAKALANLKDLATKLDPALQKKLQQLMDERKSMLNADQANAKKDGMKSAESSSGLPEETRWALEDMAAKLAGETNDRKTNPNNAAASEQSAEKGLGSPQAAAVKGESGGEMTMQLAREAASDSTQAQMMMANGGPQGAQSAGGRGNHPDAAGSAQALLLAQALRKELVEAASDTMGDNVPPKDDIRHKTEQSRSAMGFSKVTPTSFDRSHAEAPPTVPEARKPLLQNYFVRRPPGDPRRP